MPQSSESSDLSDGPITVQEFMEVKSALTASEAKIQQLLKVNCHLSEELRLMQSKVSAFRLHTFIFTRTAIEFPLHICYCIFSVAADTIFRVSLELKMCVLGLPGGPFLWLLGFLSYALCDINRLDVLVLCGRKQHSCSHALTSI